MNCFFIPVIFNKPFGFNLQNWKIDLSTPLIKVSGVGDFGSHEMSKLKFLFEDLVANKN